VFYRFGGFNPGCTLILSGISTGRAAGGHLPRQNTKFKAPQVHIIIASEGPGLILPISSSPLGLKAAHVPSNARRKTLLTPALRRLPQRTETPLPGTAWEFALEHDTFIVTIPVKQINPDRRIHPVISFSRQLRGGRQCPVLQPGILRAARVWKACNLPG